MPPTRLEVGRVAKAHGMKGQVLVAMSTNRPEQRLAVGNVLSTEKGELTVASAAPHQARWIVSFEGVTDRNGAEALHGLTLRAEPLDEEGTLWVHELIGAAVEDVSGRHWGLVEGVEANPASDLLVLPGGGLVPMTFVVERRDDGTIVIDPPAGLLDGNMVGGG